MKKGRDNRLVFLCLSPSKLQLLMTPLSSSASPLRPPTSCTNHSLAACAANFRLNFGRGSAGPVCNNLPVTCQREWEVVGLDV
ncbi:hypothetical protein E2C01_097183 [Portunus trituberculatus]|uniref:Uncharacterized protein n=1 Tax=Portunus trituberculatus TaxID=210409 RepID=A0A5B7K400_PORTR|nr:hypothetical protein [Portunus trituberculatus]